MKYVKPTDVVSPRSKVGGVLEVVHDPGPGRMVVARILWEGREEVAVRWNGDDGHPLGHPVVRRQPTWVVLDEYVARAVEERARECEAAAPTSIAAGYRAMAADQEREREAQEWSEAAFLDTGVD
ncbi:MAG: hypothetical protein FJZ01_08200 [Candidatus Sericytochromatia bacterium]|nr:hypothetical protein [Candidatus Tanganyikabacteria bacterium]